MIAFLIYISTLSGVPHQVLLIPVILIILKNLNKPIVLNKHNAFTLIVISIIVILSFLNSLIHITKLQSYFNLFPYTSLMFASFILAYFIDVNDIKFLVILILFESSLVIVEFILGINTVIYWAEGFKKIGSLNVLYNSRPLGLSENSSIIAVKIFLAILLVDYFNLFTKHKTILLLIFFIAIILTFPRTILVVLLAYYSIKILSSVKLKAKVKRHSLIIALSIMLALSVAAIIGINAIGSKIYDQFTRGTKKIELAGRPDIWARYFKFIESNKYFGNYSQKLEVNLNMNDQKQHSHNSFIQVAANHGLIIASLFLILLFGNITRRNYIYIIALAIYSLAQYGIFWGFSITDIVLFIFFQGTLLSNDKQKLIPDYDY